MVEIIEPLLVQDKAKEQRTEGSVSKLKVTFRHRKKTGKKKNGQSTKYGLSD